MRELTGPIYKAYFIRQLFASYEASAKQTPRLVSVEDQAPACTVSIKTLQTFQPEKPA